MLTGNVESSGNNVGGLIGYAHPYNKTNTSYSQYNYSEIEDSFASRRSKWYSKCRGDFTDMVIGNVHIIIQIKIH